MRGTRLIRTLYSFLPGVIKPEVYTHNNFRKVINGVNELNQDGIKEFQLEQLKKIVKYSWENISGYRQLWQEKNFSPKDLRTLEDTVKIPIVTKEILRDNISYFSSKKRNSIYISTGGSTGIPFGFYVDRRNFYIEKAFISDVWSKCNDSLSFYTKSVVLRGIKINGIYENDPIVGLYLSSYQIGDETIKEYVNLINANNYPLLQAYPSSLYQLCKKIREHNLKITKSFSCIALGSEPLYDFQRELIELVFKAPISHWYGHSEMAVLAVQCPSTKQFSVYPQYGYSEVLKKDGSYAKTGETGEVIATGFWNYATPFIRYATRDFVEVGNNNLNIVNKDAQVYRKIDGRLQEFIVGKTSKIISMTSLNMHNDIFNEIEQFRFRQECIGIVDFQYVKKNKDEKIDESKIYNGLKHKLGSEFDLILNEVEEIKNSPNGKMRFLDQKLNIDSFIK